MNATEAATLCRATKAVCPAQKIDELTPDFWHPLLEDVDFQDAKRALIEVAKRQPFVSPSEIRSEIESWKRKRVAGIPPVDPPWQLRDDEAEERRWVGNYRHAVADGLPVPQARLRADYLSGITDEPEPLAIEASQEVRDRAAAIKAEMNRQAVELVRKQSLAQADKRAKAEEKRARHAAARAAELAATEAATVKREPRDPEQTIQSHLEEKAT
jgi:hypothetical protein